MNDESTGDEPVGDEAKPSRLDQTYLVGETLYLRALEEGDAKRSPAWRRAPFPIPTERAEEILKKEEYEDDDEQRLKLLACRRADDEPVGAFFLSYDDFLSAECTLHADPAIGDSGAAVKAEMLRIAVPWLSAERLFPAVSVALDAGEAEVVAEAEQLGMRPAFRFREARWRRGERVDEVTYELLHPAWVERLGDPGPGIAEADAAPPREPASPAPIRWPASEHPVPKNAILASERLALRPMEVDDAEAISRSLRRETEDGFLRGRSPASPLVFSKWIVERSEHDPPNDIEFSVVSRETGELIGENGLYDLDLVNRTAETGTWIYDSSFRGGGYGTEAKHLLLEYAFDVLGLHMVFSWVRAANTRSAAALVKQGYRKAGRLHWNDLGPGGFSDWLTFDLLAEEWRAARK